MLRQRCRIAIEAPVPLLVVMGFLLVAFSGIQIPELGIGRRHGDRRIQIPGLMLHKTLIVDAVIVAAIEIVRGQAHPKLARDHRSHHKGIRLVGIAVLALLLQEVVILYNPGPLLQVIGLLSDHVDHAADGVRAIQGGHRPADHLDPLDGGKRRHKGRFGADMVSIRTGFAGRLLDAVYHVRGIGGVHPAHLHIAGCQAAVAVTDQHARHLAQGFGNVLIRAGVQLFFIHHGNRRRCFTAFLAKTGRGHYQFIFVYGGVFCGENGHRQVSQGERNRHGHACLLNHNGILRTGLNQS